MSSGESAERKSAVFRLLRGLPHRLKARSDRIHRSRRVAGDQLARTTSWTCKDSSPSLTSPPQSKRSRDRRRVPLLKRFLYAHVTSYRFQPALQSFGLLRADRHVSHPMEGLPHQHFADLHDRLNIGIVRRVPLELGGVWSKSACEHLSGVEGGVHHSHEGRGRSRRTATNSA
jgi:hypothetical protein